MVNKGNAMSDESLESVGGGKTIYKYDYGDVKGAKLELLGDDGNVIGRYASEKERDRAVAAMGADEVKQLDNWDQLKRLRKK